MEAVTHAVSAVHGEDEISIEVELYGDDAARLRAYVALYGYSSFAAAIVALIRAAL